MSVLIAALGLFPSVRTFTARLANAQEAIDAQDWSSAASYLAQAADQYPWRVELAIKAAHLAFQAGDPQATIGYLERPGTKDHLTTDDLLLLGDAYQQSGDPAKAEATWKHVAELINTAPVIQRLADLYLQQHDVPSALNYLQKLLTFNASDGNLYYQIGLLYATIEPLRSLPFLAQAADIDPSLAEKAQSLHDKIRTASLFERPAYTLVVAGRELANIREWSLAVDAFKQATNVDPQYSDAWAFLGEAEQQSIKNETSPFSEIGKTELDRALQLDPQSVLANTFMGLYWERRQDYSQAQHFLDQAITLNPDDPYLYSELGNILSRAGDLPAAQTAFETAIAHSPQDPTFYRLLAQFALENRIQVHELALPAARRALAVNPQDPASLDMMAQVMLELQDYHSAEDYCLKALASDPGYSPAFLHLGTAYLYLGESDQAYHWLGMAKEAESDVGISSQASRMLEYYFP